MSTPEETAEAAEVAAPDELREQLAEHRASLAELEALLAADPDDAEARAAADDTREVIALTGEGSRGAAARRGAAQGRTGWGSCGGARCARACASVAVVCGWLVSMLRGAVRLCPWNVATGEGARSCERMLSASQLTRRPLARARMTCRGTSRRGRGCAGWWKRRQCWQRS